MMARIDQLEEIQKERLAKHAPIKAGFTIFKANGETILQIDSYGSADRQIPGKVSQSLQFGEKGIEALRSILAKLP